MLPTIASVASLPHRGRPNRSSVLSVQLVSCSSFLSILAVAPSLPRPQLLIYVNLNSSTPERRLQAGGEGEIGIFF
jgi:hypothetical protein